MSSPTIHSVSVDQAGGVTASLIAAITGRKVQVMGLCLSVSGAACTVKSTLQDITANTVRMTLVGNATTPVVYPYAIDPTLNAPIFESAIGEGIELITGTAAAISGIINYRYV
jgi:hypothetical protein